MQPSMKKKCPMLVCFHCLPALSLPFFLSEMVLTLSWHMQDHLFEFVTLGLNKILWSCNEWDNVLLWWIQLWWNSECWVSEINCTAPFPKAMTLLVWLFVLSKWTENAASAHKGSHFQIPKSNANTWQCGDDKAISDVSSNCLHQVLSLWCEKMWWWSWCPIWNIAQN